MAAIRQKLERGERVSADDLRCAETLIALDVVEAGRRASEEAIEFHEQENERCLQAIRAVTGQ